jgi:hypothetical protein
MSSGRKSAAPRRDIADAGDACLRHSHVRLQRSAALVEDYVELIAD